MAPPRTFNVFDWFWYVGGDQSQAYSSATGAYVPIADAAFQAWLAADHVPTAIDSEASLWEVLRSANVPPFHKVSTYQIIRRLEDAGKIDAADTALSANKTLWRRFYTVGEINADDESARAFLTAIGTDPDQILAH